MINSWGREKTAKSFLCGLSLVAVGILGAACSEDDTTLPGGAAGSGGTAGSGGAAVADGGSGSGGAGSAGIGGAGSAGIGGGTVNPPTKDECAAGQFIKTAATETTDVECGACVSGTFSLGGNATECTTWSNCESGSHVSKDPSAEQDRECEYCAPGTFTTVENQSACQTAEACPAGTVEVEAVTPISAAVCEACVSGQHCAGGKAPAESCAAGTWDDDGSAATACVPQTHCAAGEFVGANGSATTDRSCSSCAAGTFSTVEDAAQCETWTVCSVKIWSAGSAAADNRCWAKPVQLSLGSHHSCALFEEGSVKCWGFGSFGQLGNSAMESSTVAVSVGLSGEKATAIALGDFFSCALIEGGSVKCWGSGSVGRLGNGVTAHSSIPVSVNLSGAKAAAIALGDGHACAILEDGTVKCWGSGDLGQLGNGLWDNSSTPVSVNLSGTKATAIALGHSHSCALLEDGTVKCWGYGDHGQLGNGAWDDSSTPVSVGSLGAKAIDISVGEYHSCALLEDGAAKCWGSNLHGQLGNGTDTDSWTPVPVISLGAKVTAVALGNQHSCALLEGGSLKCWGHNYSGQLGKVTGLMGDVRTPELLSSLNTNAAAIALGGDHSCASLKDGTAKCWGNGFYGQLGNSTNTDSATPVQVLGLQDIL